MSILRMVTKQTDNPKYPKAYQVQDEQGNALVSHSGLFGWGWCSSRDAAIQHAGVKESDVQPDGKCKECGEPIEPGNSLCPADWYEAIDKSYPPKESAKE